MLRLVIGGSASGKSEYAEQLILSLSEGAPVDYIATMKCSDEEVKQRIEIHKGRREGTAFHTIEKPDRLSEIDKNSLSAYGMLECVSNLLANEMFSSSAENHESSGEEKAAAHSDENADEPADSREEQNELVIRLVEEITKLAKHYTEFVVVTNDIFEDSIVFDEITRKYIRCLGDINRLLTEKAGSVTEVVCGIPIGIK